MSTTSNSLPEPIYAWVYFSAIMTTIFYGFSCMQTFFYYVHYQNDPMRMKIFVGLVWALNTIHEGLIVAGAYKYIAAALVNPSLILSWVPELALQAIFTALVAVLTQGFLMYRIYLLSGRKVIALIVWFVLGIIQLVPNIIYLANALYTANGSLEVVNIVLLNSPTLTTTITLNLSAAAGEDILIASILVYLLFRERKSTKITSTIHMLQRLTVFAVNTGVCTATFAVLTVIFQYILPSKMLYLLFALPLCSIYCNTVFANVNARAYLRDGSRPQQIDVDWLVEASPQYQGTKMVFSPPEQDVQKTMKSVTSSEANMEFTVSDVA